jgi:hypothetical protein
MLEALEVLPHLLTLVVLEALPLPLLLEQQERQQMLVLQVVQPLLQMLDLLAQPLQQHLLEQQEHLLRLDQLVLLQQQLPLVQRVLLPMLEALEVLPHLLTLVVLAPL